MLCFCFGIPLGNGWKVSLFEVLLLPSVLFLPPCVVDQEAKQQPGTPQGLHSPTHPPAHGLRRPRLARSGSCCVPQPVRGCKPLCLEEEVLREMSVTSSTLWSLQYTFFLWETSTLAQPLQCTILWDRQIQSNFEWQHWFSLSSYPSL